MSKLYRSNAWLTGAVKSDGTAAVADVNGWLALTAGTWLVPFQTHTSGLHSLNIVTDATLAGVMTIEDTNAPISASSDHDITADTAWTQENPDTAYVGTSGTGWTVADLTLTKTAGKGSAMIHFGDFGSARSRVRIVVSTGGSLRIAPCSKV